MNSKQRMLRNSLNVWLIIFMMAGGFLIIMPTFARALDLPPSDFKILNADGTRVIGHGHYEVTPDGNGFATAFGEDRFDNGEYDVEHDKLETGEGDKPPRMITFEHKFFAPDGSLERVGKADFRTGKASCTIYENGKPEVHAATLNLPPDTYAGSVIIIPLRNYLLEGGRGPVVLHDFNCIPGPKVLKVKAYVRNASTWKFYSGQVVQVDIKPDFGWLNLVVAPFVPDIRAWFSPSDDWHFVGGEFTRYYKGPQIILARVPGVSSAQTGADTVSAQAR
jgi:hypothetical protein